MWLGSLAITLVCAVAAARGIDFMVPVSLVLAPLVLVALALKPAYLKGSLSGKKFEAVSAVWTLALYLMLGLVPLWLR